MAEIKNRNIAIVAVLSLAVIGQFVSSDEPKPIASTQQTQEPEQTQPAQGQQDSNATDSQTPTSSAEPSSSPSPEVIRTEQVSTPSPTQDSTIADLLAQLEIKAESSLDYDRDLFRNWVDTDGDGGIRNQ